MGDSTEDFIPTRGSKLRKNAEEQFQSVTFVPYQKKVRKTPILIPENEEEDKSNGFNIRKAKHEVIKYGMSGFNSQKKEEAKIQLAIKLGAKPPKNKYKNYKELLKEKSLEKKTEMDRVSYQQLGKNQVGKSTAKGKSFDRKQKKRKEGLLDVYGKVKPPTH